jgi:ubiquitin-like domain-containing CTD phosphatase 1
VEKIGGGGGGGGGVTLVAKWGKERISLEGLAPTTTIGQVKNLLTVQTNILPKRQKLVGLTLAAARKGGVTDTDTLSDLKVKGKSNNGSNYSVQHQFILMGTPEENIFVDPSEKDDLPDVVDDFELDFNAGSDEVCISSDDHARIDPETNQYTFDHFCLFHLDLYPLF